MPCTIASASPETMAIEMAAPRDFVGRRTRASSARRRRCRRCDRCEHVSDGCENTCWCEVKTHAPIAFRPGVLSVLCGSCVPISKRNEFVAQIHSANLL
eukprot:6165566-Prymnesium_polylepis.1